MKVKLKNIIGIGCVLGSVFMIGTLTACSSSNIMETETNHTSRQIEIYRDDESAILNTKDFTKATARGVHDHYSKYGDGPMEVTVTYDPRSNANTAERARVEAARIQKLMSKYHPGMVEVDVLPVNNAGGISETIIYYETVNAKRPSGCDTMFERQDEGIEEYRDYELGCTTQTYIAQQVDRPADLLGRAGLADAIGARHTNVLGGYRSGDTFDAIEGFSATD